LPRDTHVCEQRRRQGRSAQRMASLTMLLRRAGARGVGSRDGRRGGGTTSRIRSSGRNRVTVERLVAFGSRVRLCASGRAANSLQPGRNRGLRVSCVWLVPSLSLVCRGRGSTRGYALLPCPGMPFDGSRTCESERERESGNSMPWPLTSATSLTSTAMLTDEAGRGDGGGGRTPSCPRRLYRSWRARRCAGKP